jgi:tetratricopeptide (TPR) repeat protein
MKPGLLLPFAVLAVSSFAQQRESELDRYSDEARQALAAKKWDDAAQALEHLAKLAPDVPEVHANLGLAYFFEGHPAEALASFERARKLNPSLQQVDAMIGVSEAEVGRCNEAVPLLTATFDRPVDEDTGRLSGLHLLRCYSQLKQADKALVVGEGLLTKYPRDPEVLYQVSRLHAERSSELMSVLAQSAPDSAWTHYANGQVQEGLQRLQAATHEYQQALQKDPSMIGVHYRLGRLILQGSRTPAALEQAKREFQQEIALSRANADAEYELAEIHREQGHAQEAIAHFKNAVQYHPGFVEAQVGLAKTLLESGRTADALPHLQEAARLDPENKIPHYLLASAYKALGNANEAAKEFAAYKKLGTGGPSVSSRSSSPERH